MKIKTILTGLLIATFNFIVLSQPIVDHEFTLQQCIDYALENSELIKNAELTYRSDKALVGEILADGLPQVDASVSVANNYKVPTSFIPASIIPAADRPPGVTADDFIPVNFQTQYNASGSVTLNQLIFDGSYFIGIKAARTFTQLAQKDHHKSKIDVVEAVTKAYYTVLVTNENQDLVWKNYNRLDTLLMETTLLYENGFAEKIDVNRVKVEFNNISVKKENMERTLLLSYSLLKFQMSMPVDENLILMDNISDIQFALDEDITSDFDYGQRIEFSRLQTSEELAAIDMKYIKSGYLPKLEGYITAGSLAGTQSAGDLTNFNDRWFGFGVYGLNLSMPIFDGLRKSRQIQQRRLKADGLQNEFSRLKKTIDMEIESSRLILINSFRNMEVQKENMALAEEVYEITRIKYQQGVGSNLEVIEADSSFKQAQTNYYSALYNTLISKVDYKKALGKLY